MSAIEERLKAQQPHDHIKERRDTAVQDQLTKVAPAEGDEMYLAILYIPESYWSTQVAVWAKDDASAKEFADLIVETLKAYEPHTRITVGAVEKYTP